MRDDAPVGRSPDRAADDESDRASTFDDDRLAAVFARARANVARRVSVLRSLTDTLADGRPDEAVQAAAEQQAHTLAGTAGTFGLSRVSELALELEELLAQRTGDHRDACRAQHLTGQMTAALGPGEPDGDRH